MSTETHQAPAAQQSRATEGKGTSFGRAVRSETIKFTSVPSSLILLLTTLVIMIGIAAVAAWGIGSSQEALSGDPEAAAAMGDMEALGNSIASSGIMFSQLIVGSIGVLVMSSEFTTGMARATFAAIPKRFPVVLAKTLLVAVVSLVVTVVSTLLAALVIMPILSNYSLEQDLSSETFQRYLWIGAAYVAVIALLGMSLGGLLRNSAGAIVTLVGIVFVLPNVLMIFANDFIQDASRFLPDAAFGNLIGATPAEGALEQWQSGVVLGLWALVPVVVTLLVIRRRDV